MRHHLRRAKHIYDTQGSKELAKTALLYIPIEINNIIFRMRYGPRTRVIEEDWDNLIILDACRYDMFADRIQLDGELQSRISLGSTSEEFLKRNFGDGTFHDTVYVNTNPYLPRLDLDDGTFHAVIDLLNEWDSELETIRPETVVDAAQKAHEEYPDKRLIVHFMQPHAPFIGAKGKQIGGAGWSTDDETASGMSIWGYLRNGSIDADLDQVWDAYLENLDIVLSHVQYLSEIIGGQTVLTADHGNLVGERLSPLPTRRKYGHPYGVYTEELVNVPWFIVESDTRRKITTERPIDQETQSDELVEERLQALGYK